MQQTRESVTTLLALLILLAVGSGCSKSLQAQAGAKSLEGGSGETTFADPPVAAGNAQGHDLSAAPSLSVDGTLLEPGSQSSGDIPGEMLIARAEPSPEAQQRLEEMRRAQAATAAAGLHDVYFDFDRWTLNDQGREALQANADWLRSNPGKSVTIQGHCDERGTSSYNLVLGEKRARAIRKFLVDLGIKPDRLSVVSFGKERPFCQEHSETCHQQNRRGHLVVGATSHGSPTN